MNLLQMFFRGGVFMYPILLCSILVMYIAIERLIALRAARLDVRQFMLKVRNIFQNGDVGAVLAFSFQKDMPIAKIVYRGIVKHNLDGEHVRESLGDAGREEVYHLKKHFVLLSSIAGIAPMLGFLGTAVSIVSVLQKVEGAAGISDALVATIFGLIVGIVAYAFYKYFVTRVDRFAHETGVAMAELLDMLQRKNAPVVSLKVQEEAHTPSRMPKSRTTLVFEDDAYFRKKS